MNGNAETSKRSADRTLAGDVNSECASRWIMHCICCEKPVEPWQTAGYQFGYCAECFGVLMEPGGMGCR